MNQDGWMNLLLASPVPNILNKPDGIIFDDVHFTEPCPFLSSPPFPPFAGLYAITVPELNARPRTYRVIYFGQAERLSERVRTAHEKYQEWLTEAGTASRLYVSFHAMFGAESQRIAIEARLIEKYQPVCNKQFNPWYALLGVPRGRL